MAALDSVPEMQLPDIKAELQNQIKHLERSNLELQEAVAGEGEWVDQGTENDPDLMEAIAENRAVRVACCLCAL